MSSGYDWMHAQADAAKKIGTLISFLSLVWNVPVEVQESPAPLEWGERLPQDRPAWVKEDAFTHHEYPDMADLPPFELPDWMESGWILLNRRAKLQRALSIYMEGVRIQDKHPSLALVSFVAAVESISLMLFHEQKCSTCPNHINIGEKFRATLELVVAGGELESLRAVYGNRSRTVHEGRLHGAEVSPGFISFSLFGGGSSDAVVRGSLLGMGNAARKLLIMAVRGQLPGISHFRKE
ncbi:hypothetical protein [Streptomyces rubiginosohelvolus]|uniref:hypothetical protein n=1 Tax=Streptomyces rubiginosohelvolus TaxID=67362 RepID=UPI0037A383E5